jgi:archaellum biogenesis protein FlaJ (TadC family)
LRDSHGALSWSDYWHGKLENLSRLAGSWPRGLLDPLLGPFTTWSPEAVRFADFFALVPSLHLFALAAIVALALLAGTPQPQRAIAARMLVAVVATLGAFVLLIFMPGETINHHGTYAVHAMITIFAFMILMLRAPWLALVFIAAQAVSVAVTYAFSLPHDPAFWPLPAACGAATLFLAGYSLAPRFAR